MRTVESILAKRINCLTFEYANNVLLNEQSSKSQSLLNPSDDCVLKMRFTLSMYKMLLQDWIASKPSFVLTGKGLDEIGSKSGGVDRFSYLNSCTSPGGRTSNKVSSDTGKVRLTSINSRGLWRRHNIPLSIKRRVYTKSVRSVLLYGSETWALRANVRRNSVFEPRLDRMWWENSAEIHGSMV